MAAPWTVFIRIWCLAGFISIIIVGTLLHFVYDWTGRWQFIGLFVPVNESVWEHLKMGNWALLLFSAVEYPSVRGKVHNYALAKALGILALNLTILAVFYTYTAFTAESILWVDITSFLLGALGCQMLAYTLYCTKPAGRVASRLSLVFWAGLNLLFVVYTLYPPRLDLFKDHRTNTYGIYNTE